MSGSILDAARSPKTVLKATLQKVIAGIAAHYGSTSTLVLNGVTITPADLMKALQSHIDAEDAVAALTAQRHVAVMAVKTKSVSTGSLLHALDALVIGQFGNDSQAQADFGFPARKVGKTTVTVKADAVTKAAATRKSNGTLGTKQRKAKAKAPTPPAQASVPSNGSHPQG